MCFPLLPTCPLLPSSLSALHWLRPSFCLLCREHIGLKTDTYNIFSFLFCGCEFPPQSAGAQKFSSWCLSLFPYPGLVRVCQRCLHFALMKLSVIMEKNTVVLFTSVWSSPVFVNNCMNPANVIVLVFIPDAVEWTVFFLHPYVNHSHLYLCIYMWLSFDW